MIHAFEVPGDITTQGEDASSTEGFELTGGAVFEVKIPVLDGEFDKIGLQVGSAEEFVNANKELPLFAIVFAAVDVR